MPGLLLTTTTPLLCAHGGQARAAAPQPRVRAAGAPVLTQGAPLLVSGCTNVVPPGTPAPCVTVQFITGAVRVRVNGLPALLQDGVSMCTPTGTPLTVVPLQTRVRGV
jgi:uncharacterized Zn-binding protein involved in type VI secretion